MPLLQAFRAIFKLLAKYGRPFSRGFWTVPQYPLLMIECVVSDAFAILSAVHPMPQTIRQRMVRGGTDQFPSKLLPVLPCKDWRAGERDNKWLDNASGHYQPTGPQIQNIAESAFGKIGLDATGKFEFKVWGFGSSLARGGKWVKQ